MAGTASEWTTMGSNTNSTINTDSAEEANIDNTQGAAGASGTNNRLDMNAICGLLMVLILILNPLIGR